MDASPPWSPRCCSGFQLVDQGQPDLVQVPLPPRRCRCLATAPRHLPPGRASANGSPRDRPLHQPKPPPQPAGPGLRPGSASCSPRCPTHRSCHSKSDPPVWREEGPAQPPGAQGSPTRPQLLRKASQRLAHRGVASGLECKFLRFFPRVKTALLE